MNRIFAPVLFSLSLLVSVPRAPAQALFKLNQYNVLYRGDLMPVFTLFTTAPISRTLSVSGYFYINAFPKGSWGEGLAGLT